MAPTFGRERAPNKHEEERLRRLKYQKEVEEKIERELQKIRDEEAENRKKIEAERERKRKKEELAKQIQDEIAAIKRMDEERTKKIKEEEEIITILCKHKHGSIYFRLNVIFIKQLILFQCGISNLL